MRARPSIAKRAREKDRAERQQDKAEKKALLKEGAVVETAAGEDPDIAWITPGPQKLDPELFGLPNQDD